MNLPKKEHPPEFAVALVALCLVTAAVLFMVGLYVAEPAAQSPTIELSEPEEVSQEESRQWDSQNDPDELEIVETPQVREGRVGALPPRDEWLPKFAKAKRALIKSGKVLCEACGRSPESCGKVSHDCHHQISVERIINDKLDPSLKWDQSNLIILCRPSTDYRTDPDDKGCHFLLGHRAESWAVSNPNVRADSAKQFKRMHPGKTYGQLTEEYFENSPRVVPQAVKDRKRAKMPAKSGSQF